MSLIRCCQIFLLCCCFNAAAATTTAPVAEACVAECGVRNTGCQQQQLVGQVCSDGHRVCVERCDPHRISKLSVLALYPPSGSLVSGPRDRLAPEAQLSLCRQDCAMHVYTCMGGERAFVDGSHASGRNQQSHCQKAARHCESRCVVTPL